MAKTVSLPQALQGIDGDIEAFLQTVDPGRRQSIRAVVRRLMQGPLERVPGDVRALALRFAVFLLGQMDERYLRQHSGRHLPDQLVDTFAFARVRCKGQTLLRVFTPTLEANGYAADGTVIEVVTDERPFVFDTIRLFLNSAEAVIRNATHATLAVERDDEGVLRNVRAPVKGNGEVQFRHELYCRFYIERVTDEAVLSLYHQEIEARLSLAELMVRDFHRMRKVVMDVRNEYEYLSNVLDPKWRPYLEEARAFLSWLIEDNFIFNGISFYGFKEDSGELVVVPSKGLGVLRGQRIPTDRAIAAKFFARSRPMDPYFIQVRKSPEESVIHRAGKIDEILMRRFDLDGEPAGGVVVHGLFTYKAISSAGGEIPILRRKLDAVLEGEQVVEEGYHYREMLDAFNSLPVEYLFIASADEIRRLLRTLLRAQTEQRLEVHLTADEATRSAYVFAVIPREIYSDALRARIQDLVKNRMGATYADHRASMAKGDSVILHFFLTGGADFRVMPEDELAQAIIRLASPWSEQLRHALIENLGDDLGGLLFARYGRGFPDSYQAMRGPAEAARDVRCLEKLSADTPVVFDIRWPQTPEGDEEDHKTAHLVIYQRRGAYLTDVLPVLDHFGLRVRDQVAHGINSGNGWSCHINTFRVDALVGGCNLVKDRDRIIEALRAVFEGRVRDDAFNALVIHAGLRWQEVDILRALTAYARQIKLFYDPDFVQRVLRTYPAATRLLADIFAARFEPDDPHGRGGDEADAEAVRQRRVERLRAQFEEELRGIRTYAEDRVLRTFLNLIEATVRTNAYRDDRPFHYVSFKIDCSRVHSMPSPRPWREIFVHHVAMEGVHLRGGPVARGGIRWSDRPDDYRTEILGLMRTQMVKNSLIVPVGAKGGFVLRTHPPSGTTMREFADRMYRVLIRGMLDVTDNRIGDEVVHPPGVLCYDGPDPYLVVAADKGTAHLSDTANALSEECGFWLGDAFASGGTTGYDHKKEGITARGAWACVREHFRALGIDPEKDPITVVGIGDMSGDVFGNGMLLSRTLKLVGAFNHRHIFIDPDPDPEKSYQERKRLFELPGSGWDDYDPDAISEGGGVFNRDAKSIELSEPIRKLLGTEATEMSGADLIRALLCLDVDLLWNGGIGTYVKASWEDNRDVGDKANDDVRVDASELRVRVVGEGGNLGFTPAARIEFARTRRGRINTDFIDNAGGVNLSDHEVNLKVLFASLVERGELSLEDRNRILADATGEVCRKVVEDNALQSLRLSLDEIRSRRDIFAFGRTVRFLKEAGVIADPRAENLPSLKELSERATNKEGLTRPELATLGAYAKMHAYRALVSGPPLHDSDAEVFLREYFPACVYQRFHDAIRAHMLRRAIVATVQVNLTLDYAGADFFAEVAADTDRTPTEIATAYLVLHRALDLWALKRRVHEANLPLHAELAAMLFIEDAVRDGVVLVLQAAHGDPTHYWTLERRERVARLVQNLARSRKKLFGGPAPQPVQRAIDELERAGLPNEKLRKDVARVLVSVAVLPPAILADQTGLAPAKVARVWFALRDKFGADALERALVRHSSSSEWEILAMRALRRDIANSLMALTITAAEEGGSQTPASRAVDRLFDRYADLAQLARRACTVATGTPDLAALVVLTDRLRAAVGVCGANAAANKNRRR